MYLKSNNVTLKTKDGPVIANSVVLALNSPVIKDQILNAIGEETTLDFEGYSKESVKVFLKACYQGRLDLQRENMPHIHKMSHLNQVFWLAEAVFNDYKTRVKRCAEKTYDFETALFLFKEAVSTLHVLKKRSFVDVFIQSFAAVPESREKFLELYLKNMHKYSAEELKIAAELSGARVDIVVNALANHILEFKTLDTNARSLLQNINFSYLKLQHKSTYEALIQMVVQNKKNFQFNPEDYFLLVEILSHDFVKVDVDAPPKAWNRNITLSNLFQSRLPDDEFGDACDKSLASLSVCSNEMYHSSKEDIEEDEEWDNEGGSQESEDSVDSSHEDTEDTARFKDRMMKLKASESISNLYMMIEDLWDWILSQGNKKLEIEFEELMPALKCIRTQRGWFKISPQFIDCIENVHENENVKEFREAVKNTPALFSKKENHVIVSRDEKDDHKYNLKTLFQESKGDGKLAFEFQHERVKDCKREGVCGFLFKLKLGSNDDFEIELGYSKSDFDNLNPKVHFHDDLMFAQRMHVMITGYKGKHWCLPLSWEDKPTFDENKNMIRWGRHRFPVEVRAGSSLSEGASSSSKTSTETKPDPTSAAKDPEPSSSTSIQPDPGNGLERKTEDCSDWVYQWGAEDKVRLMVFYCTE